MALADETGVKLVLVIYHNGEDKWDKNIDLVHYYCIVSGKSKNMK